MKNYRKFEGIEQTIAYLEEMKASNYGELEDKIIQTLQNEQKDMYAYWDEVQLARFKNCLKSFGVPANIADNVNEFSFDVYNARMCYCSQDAFILRFKCPMCGVEISTKEIYSKDAFLDIMLLLKAGDLQQIMRKYTYHSPANCDLIAVAKLWLSKPFRRNK